MTPLTGPALTPRRLIYPAFGSGGVSATLTVSTVDDWTVIEATGDVEWGVARGLRSLLLSTPSDSVVVDLGAVAYLDHHGLAVLARAHHYRRARGGQVRLVAAPSSSLMVMRGARAYDLPAIYPTIGEAVA